MAGNQPPWERPPVRRKKLATRKAERAARRGRLWGERIQQATEEGPDALAEVHFDRARAELKNLPDRQRATAFSALADAIDAVRQRYTE